MTKRHIIIGDVHGMAQEVKAIIATVKPTADDVVVFVGDLVDKGPESAEVVRFVREMAEVVPVVVVEGNHEEKHRRFRKSRNMEMKGADEMAHITDGMDEDDIAFMESFVPFHRIPEHNVMVVHAGIPADMQSFPESVEEVAAMSNKQRKSFQKVMRTRFVDAETGKMIPLGEQKDSDPFWAEVFDGRFGHVVFGHEPFMDGPKSFPHATGIDTGAVFGGRMTAMVFTEGEEAANFVSVPSRGKFCKQFGEE